MASANDAAIFGLNAAGNPKVPQLRALIRNCMSELRDDRRRGKGEVVGASEIYLRIKIPRKDFVAKAPDVARRVASGEGTFGDVPSSVRERFRGLKPGSIDDVRSEEHTS